MTNTEDWRYKIAKRRVKKVKAFYKHFGTWLVFTAFFVFLNVTTSRGDFWAIWPIMGWGLGVALHAIGVFGLPGLGKDWEEKLMEKEMSRVDQATYEREIGAPKQLPEDRTVNEDGLDLKEVRKAWRDSDLV